MEKDEQVNVKEAADRMARMKEDFAKIFVSTTDQRAEDKSIRAYLLKRIEDYCCDRLCDGCDVWETCLSDGRFASGMPTYRLLEIYYAMYPDMNPDRQRVEEAEKEANEQIAKADAGKPIFTWVPPAIIQAIERVRAFGNKKYHDPDNWRNVSPDRYWQAYLRHTIAAWWDFRKKDKESGLRHIDHCACNLAFIMQFLEDEELPEDDGLHCKHCLYFDEDEDGDHCSECKYAHVDNFVRRTHD